MTVTESRSKTSLIPTESLDLLLKQAIESKEWQNAQDEFNECELIFIIGNGGNLAVADHGAVDITRLSGKLAIAPGSGILATSVIGDSSINTWFSNWLSAHIKNLKEDQLKKTMIIGVSSSGTAENICSCLTKGSKSGMKTLMISARKLKNKDSNFNTICLGTDFYHTGEVLSLMLFYQLIHGSGSNPPSISGKIGKPSFDRLVNSEI